MVTVLYPSPAPVDGVSAVDSGVESFSARNTESVSGFTFSEGERTVTVQATRAAQELSGGAITATARLLVVREDAEGDITGLALDCSAIAVNGKAQRSGVRDFEFTFSDGNWHATAIEAPETFRWEDDGKGNLTPRYH